MSKVFKKNKVLFLSLIAMGVVALGLIVVVIIVFFDWSAYRAQTETLRNKVQQLRTSKPAPGQENMARIQRDIELYQDKNIGLVDNFKSPLRPAVDAFLRALPPPLADQLTDEEKEEYKVEGTGVEGDDETPAVPLQIRKLTYDDFRKFFPERFQRFCDENGIPDERKYSLSVLTQFVARCIQLFPAGSWAAAMNEFERVARPLTWEQIDNANRLAILLGAFGLPRRVADNISELQVQVAAIQNALKTEVGEDFFVDGALNFIGGSVPVSGSGSSGSSSSGVNYPAWQPADYPYVFFHWDVFGDIVRRLKNSGAMKLHRVIPRLKDSDDQNAPIVLAESFEEDGNYKIYHYTVVFSGSMASLRAALVNFDSAWQGGDGRGRRMYVVRGLAMFASHDGAGEIMQQSIESRGTASQDEQSQSGSADRRPRRRRRSAQEQPSVQSGSGTAASGTAYRDASYAERRARYYEIHRRLKEEEEARNNPRPTRRPRRPRPGESAADTGTAARERQPMTPEELDEYESKLPFNQRFGYAEALVGNNECIFYLDIDYVVLEQNQ